MYLPPNRTQQVTLSDYFLQAKKVQPKVSGKLSSTHSETNDCFTPESQKVSASQTSKSKKKHLDPPKLPSGTLIDIESKDLLPGFQQRPAFNPENIQIDDLVLCHITGYLSPTGKIPSNLESGYSIRPTTHFSLNHPVGEVPGQGTVWKSKEYCILIPLKDGLKLNGKPAGCLEVDTYWDKSFDYNSNQAILLVQKEDVPVGQAEVLKPSSQGLPEDSKVLILATCELPHDAADKILPKMGRTLLKPGVVTWGDYGNPKPTEFYKDSKNTEGKQRIGFKRFLKNNRLTEMMHCFSPHLQYEGLIRRIQILQLLNQNMWQYNSTNYKMVLLEKLQQIKQELTPEQQKKLKCDEIETIIQGSVKPSDAINSIKPVFNIQHIMEPSFYDAMQGKEKLIHQFPDQKKALFSLQDKIFGQNLSDKEKSEIQTAKDSLLGSIPIYSEASRPKGPDLKAMYLARLFEQENQALFALLEDTCQNQNGVNQFSDKKVKFQKIREDFRQKLQEVITGKIEPPSYKDMLLKNVEAMEDTSHEEDSVSSTSTIDLQSILRLLSTE